MSDLHIELPTMCEEEKCEMEGGLCDFCSSIMFIESGTPDSSYSGQTRDIYKKNQYKRPVRRKRVKHDKPIKQKRAEFFLSHIPMGGEGQIQGFLSANEGNINGETDGRVTPTEIVEISGKVNYVYKSLQKIYEPGAELKSGLYVFSPNKSFPIAVTSIIGDDADDEKSTFEIYSDSDDELLCEKMKNIRKNKEPEKILNVSYREYIKPFTAVNTENIYLDNAFIQQSSQTSIFLFNGWISSVIPYTKETQLKKELNCIFQENYPDIPTNFTLSKLRKLKHLALMLCMPSIVFPSIPTSLVNQETVSFDIGSLALAFCYFERLALYGHVNKENRKTVVADCLLIAYKFNQLCEVPSAQKTASLTIFLNELCVLFECSSDDILENEIEVLVALEFNLLIPYDQYIEHIFWILRKLDTNLQTYLGEEMYKSYYESLHYDDMEVKDDEDGEEEMEITEGLHELDSEVILESDGPEYVVCSKNRARFIEFDSFGFIPFRRALILRRNPR